MKAVISILLVSSLLLAPASVNAGWTKKPEFRLTYLYRYDLRKDFRNIYADCISATFSYLDDQGRSLLKLTPFFEMSREIKWDIWERKEIGLEIGKDIFPWVYFGDAIQKVWTRENDIDWVIPFYEKRDYMESETRLCFSRNLLSVKNFKVKGFILDEYIFDFDRGAWLCNEVAIGIILPLSKYVEAKVNWGHIKRHNYDSDTAEFSLSLIF